MFNVWFRLEFDSLCALLYKATQQGLHCMLVQAVVSSNLMTDLNEKKYIFFLLFVNWTTSQIANYDEIFFKRSIPIKLFQKKKPMSDKG